MQVSLNTTSSGGTQTSTQNPQSATSDSNLTSSENALQSGQVNLFNSTTGKSISLAPSSASPVSLQSSSVSKLPIDAPTSKHHHVSSVALAIVIVVFIIAIAIFWKTTLAAKSTTED